MIYPSSINSTGLTTYEYLLKLYTRFHLQDLFNCSSFLIYILKNLIWVTNITGYKHSIFSSFILGQIILPYFLLDISCIWTHSIFLICHVTGLTGKRLFWSFTFNLKNQDALKSRKTTTLSWLLYQSIYSISALSQKNKNHQISFS